MMNTALPAASEIEAEPVRAHVPADSPEPGGPLPPSVESPDPGDTQASRTSVPKPPVERIADVTVARVVGRGGVATSERAEADRVPRSDRPHRYDTRPPEVVRAETERPRPGHPIPPREPARATPRRPLGHRAPVSSLDGADGEHLVQGSIGRIEVRAVAPAAPPAAPRRGGAMTIEEYIAKRRERR
jgi:hypothetical protein